MSAKLKINRLPRFKSWLDHLLVVLVSCSCHKSPRTWWGATAETCSHAVLEAARAPLVSQAETKSGGGAVSPLGAPRETHPSPLPPPGGRLHSFVCDITVISVISGCHYCNLSLYLHVTFSSSVRLSTLPQSSSNKDTQGGI